jgi:hypothetical protein
MRYHTQINSIKKHDYEIQTQLHVTNKKVKNVQNLQHTPACPILENLKMQEN